jgi:hypothetical protein
MLTKPVALCLRLSLVALFVSSNAFAGPQPQAPTPADAGDDESVVQLAEPDFRLINLQTTLRLPSHKLNFDLTHRFNGNLRRGSFSDQAGDLFGLDEGATIGFELRYAIAPHVQVAAYRTSFNKTVEFYGKYDAIHQHGGVPLSMSAVVAAEGVDNFHSQYEPSVGAVASRAIGTVAALYVAPTWVHNSASAAGIDRNTFYVGLGSRVRLASTLYVAAEVSPRVSGYAPGKPEFGFAVETRVGGHMFQIDFTNTSGTTFGQVARGGFPDSLYLGFNLARKFY